MLNGIWGFFLIGGILTGAFLGRMDMVTGAILSGGRSAMELAFAMAGVISVWSGVLKIAERGGMIDRLAARLTPLMDFLFPSVPRLHPARKYIATNFVANFLGLGWAATPAGLMAMKELQRLNREERGRASGAMCMFLTVNMTSLQLVTMNILAYRMEYGSQNPAEIIGVGIAATMGILLTISDLLIPVTVLCIVVFGCLQRMDIYEVFLEGAKEGLQTVLDILPTLIGLMMAVEVMRAGGLLDILVRLIRPAAEAVGFPAELAPLSLVRLVSSSAATGLLTDLFAEYGPDSFLGRTASVMMSCTETVFYTMSLYFLSVGIRKTRYTLPCALLANLVGIFAAVALVRLVF